MYADRLHGEVGGLALEIESFVGPCEIARADRRVLQYLGHYYGVVCGAHLWHYVTVLR